MQDIRPAPPLDASDWPWTVEAADAVLCMNMIHIAPWSATLDVLRGAGKVLPPGAPLILYNPFLRADVQTAQDNMDFDADLRRRNPEWGIRSLVEVARAAEGFSLEHVVGMPTNYPTVIFRRV